MSWLASYIKGNKQYWVTLKLPIGVREKEVRLRDEKIMDKGTY